MKMNRKQMVFLIILFAFIITILPNTVSANSAEPPSLVILINNPPDDLTIVMISNEHQPEASIRRIAWEGYYIFYSRGNDRRRRGHVTRILEKDT